MLIPRHYQELDNYLKKGKVLVIYGPRRVGKTTLLQQYLKSTKMKYRLDSGDNISVQQVLSSGDFTQISNYVSGYELVVIDEAQKIPDIGVGLKIVVDENPQIKVIATGSSSFELAGQVGEPLTGRKRTLTLLPISQIELANLHNVHERTQSLPERMVFGSYPEVVTAQSKEEKVEVLEELVNSYLLKDILEMERVKGSKVLLDLLRLIAFQVGSEVSLNELGRQLSLDSKTVLRYLDLFEKSFVIYNLRGYSRNLRKEVVKKSKYYFYDNGLRNAVISNFNDLDLRDDVGKLWENFLVSERLKYQEYLKIHSNNYFWRTWDKKEIDWVEEHDGGLWGYEFKWHSRKSNNPPKDWAENYPNASYEIIDRGNVFNFLDA